MQGSDLILTRRAVPEEIITFTKDFFYDVTRSITA
jgi:hypothetical protein